MQKALKIKSLLGTHKREGFATIKEHCLSDCKNFLGIEAKNALMAIESYLIDSYEAGKVEGAKKIKK